MDIIAGKSIKKTLMSIKKQEIDNKGSAGGAAAAGGISFQVSVAALAMVHAVLELDDYSVLGIEDDFSLCSVHLETAHAVDDVVLIGDSGRALIQAKRTIVLSDKVTSQYSAALSQFVTHHFTARKPGDRYLLATSTRSSGRIIFDLRKLTESVRLNAAGLRDNPLTDAESEVIRKTHKLIAHHIAAVCRRDALQTEVDEVFASIWVLPLDLDAGGRDEMTAITLLRSRSKVSPKLVWGAITVLAETLAVQRASVDLNGLQDRIGRYLLPIERKKTVEDEFEFDMVKVNQIAAGKEVVLFDEFLGTEGLSIVEFYRFSEDGNQRIKFRGDICTLSDGSVHRYSYRSATTVGLTRFLEANKTRFLNSKLTLVPYNGQDNPNDGPWALARQELLTGLMNARLSLLKCVICDDPISEDRALLVEIDEEDLTHDCGYAHARCHRPSLRVLGEIQSALFAQFGALKDFDYQAWILANKHGPGILYSMKPLEPIAIMGWKPGTPRSIRGQRCIQLILDDKSSYYVTNRGRVERFGTESVDKDVAVMNERLSASWKRRDPWCVTPDYSMFGNFSTIAPTLKPGERLLRCTEARAAEFTAAIDKAYSSPQNFYTPVAILSDRKTGNPIEINQAIFLVSEPLELTSWLENWEEAGLQVPEYSVVILEKDEDFDALMLRCLRTGLQLFIDPLFDLRGDLMKGYDVQPLEEIRPHSGQIGA